MTFWQRSGAWVSLWLLMAIGEVSLLLLLVRRGISLPMSLFLSTVLPGVTLLFLSAFVPPSCLTCRRSLPISYRLREMFQGKASAPRCTRCRSRYR